MGDSYVEVLVPREKNNVYAVLRIVMYALAAMCVVVGLLGFIFVLAGAVIFGLLGAFAVPDAEIEYEYLYMDKELSIDKIIAKSKRKHVKTYDINKMEVMCPLNSHELDSYKNRKVPVKDYSSSNPDVKPYVIVIRDAKEEVLVAVEPDEKLINAIKTVFPRKVVEY